MPELLHDLVADYTLRTVALGSAALGLVAGALGAFAVLRQQSLLGDAVSHAALPGIVLAFMITGTKAPLVLVLGAAIAGWVASLLIMLVVRTTRLKTDTALGLMLSVFFGLGMLLMSVIQRSAGAGQAGLETFLFGQAAALVGDDLVTMAVLGGVVLVVLAGLWKEFKLLSFDAAFAGALGLPVRVLDVALTTLLVIAIVIGLQTVGVVLMSALIVAPAAAARQWTDKLGRLVLLAGGFGALSGLVGAVISSSVPRLPTGPTIILVITAITVLSLLAAPRRGVLAAWWRRWQQRRELQTDRVLADLYRLAAQHDEPARAAHQVDVLQTMSPRAGVRRSLAQLAGRGLAVEQDDGQWRLTRQGVGAGREVVDRGGPDGRDPAGRDRGDSDGGDSDGDHRPDPGGAR
ncbi:metal ABC transporter permease [bacterium]|nr:metal ABC transporter permease [bacterium]